MEHTNKHWSYDPENPYDVRAVIARQKRARRAVMEVFGAVKLARGETKVVTRGNLVIAAKDRLKAAREPKKGKSEPKYAPLDPSLSWLME